MYIELARRALPADDEANPKRGLELFAYFTVPKLEVSHRQLPLVAAMVNSAGYNNLSSALHFANQILANGGSPKMLERVSFVASPAPLHFLWKHLAPCFSCSRVTNLKLAYLSFPPWQARTMKARCERNPFDKHPIDFDQSAEFDICAASYTPVYKGTSSSSCSYDGSMYHAQYKGQVCRICEVVEIGKQASSY